MTGQITHPGYEHLSMTLFVVRIDPERYLSWRWHPHAVDPWTDYSQEPMTLVEFSLEDAGEGTALTIVESGFARIPVARRAMAFRMNDEGWTLQLANIAQHLSPSPRLDASESAQ